MTFIHGLSDTSLYRRWTDMKYRCLNPNCARYADYGGRGISICDEWQRSFEAFADWAFDNGYAADLSLDRIDNDKGYSPENCRWATAMQQRANTRKRGPYIKRSSRRLGASPVR